MLLHRHVDCCIYICDSYVLFIVNGAAYRNKLCGKINDKIDDAIDMHALPPEHVDRGSKCMSEMSHASNPVSELVVEKKNEQRNAHWFSFQRSELSAKADAAPVDSPLSMKDLKGDSQLPEASSMSSKISYANESNSKSKHVDEQRNVKWFTGMLDGHAGRQVSTDTRQHKVHICCYIVYNSVGPCSLLSLSCVVSGWGRKEKTVLVPF